MHRDLYRPRTPSPRVQPEIPDPSQECAPIRVGAGLRAGHCKLVPGAGGLGSAAPPRTPPAAVGHLSPGAAGAAGNTATAGSGMGEPRSRTARLRLGAGEAPPPRGWGLRGVGNGASRAGHPGPGAEEGAAPTCSGRRWRLAGRDLRRQRRRRRRWQSREKHHAEEEAAGAPARSRYERLPLPPPVLLLFLCSRRASGPPAPALLAALLASLSFSVCLCGRRVTPGARLARGSPARVRAPPSCPATFFARPTRTPSWGRPSRLRSPPLPIRLQRGRRSPTGAFRWGAGGVT